MKKLPLVDTSGFVRNRLDYLSAANGVLQKGNFLIAKKDVFKIECPLWRIDNQNLLQKYVPILIKDNEIEELCYKNSSLVFFFNFLI